jgi:DNA processing protein
MPLASSPEEALARLRLIRSDAVGPATFWALLERFGTAAAALDALPGLALRGGARTALRVASAEDARAEIAAAERFGAKILHCGEPSYPEPLAQLDPAPPVVTVKGASSVFAKRAVAIVGARNASAIGRTFAETLAQELSDAGFAIVSGLARGIDAAAHRGALKGGTVAVLAGGINVLYPPENAGLALSLQETGALVSEMPFGVEPLARHFPRRNRIISGLSLGVVVVEAALHSGSLITARYALEQNRDVFAVPGSPLDPRARGTNDLIRQGAILTESAHDVLAVLAATPWRTPPPLARALSARPAPEASDPGLQRRVLELLSPTPVGIDDLAGQLDAPPAALSAALLELELAGRLTRHPGHQVSLP